MQPDEIYNLGAQSHVRVSFDLPVYTSDVAGLGTMRLLEAIRDATWSRGSTRPRRARCSAVTAAADETTPFHPRSPYAVREGLQPTGRR